MDQTERSADGDDVEETNGATMSEEEWIELMNKNDSLEQYAKDRQSERKDD